ncbi:MAG: hypothetical protein V7K88_14385 [Nostoc sp.]|uniref:hypothetical protein n=1 Tax=Nostoc sp. TaxID=1180 RepID=UPI002FF4AE56
MNTFKELLFKEYPLIKEITDIADEEKNRPRADGKSHMETMASILGEQGARAVMYDAVAVEASRVVKANPQLREYFTEEGTRVINISKSAVDTLKEQNLTLYTLFEDGVRTGLARDGGQLAVPQQSQSSNIGSEPIPARTPFRTPGDIVRGGGMLPGVGGASGWVR